MPDDLVLTNATVLDGTGLRTGVDITIRDSLITSVIAADGDRRAGPAAVGCRGRLLIPSDANVHNHN
jgi:N-acyl-D-aspartate/D-glutamate deacylase